MAASKSDGKKPVFDVVPPGTSAPSATSKPIIVGHGPMLKDPTITVEKSDDDSTQQTTQAPKTTVTSKTISPLSADTKGSDTQPDETPADPTQEDTVSEARTSIASNAIVDAVVDQATNKKESESSAYDQEKIDQLIKDKTYFVKLHKPPKQSAINLVLWVVLLVLVVATALIIARGLDLLDFTVPLLDELVRS